jgi:aldehyde dehydrogenase (NAD+)
MAGKNYIGGQWTASATEETFESKNPSHKEEVVGVFPRSNQEDVARAVAAAREAFPAWRRLSRIRRGEYLDEFAQVVKANHEDLARLITRESGKPINEARADVVEGLHMAQYVFGRARMPLGDVVASEVAEKDSYALRKPKGVVAAITPWNFPFAIPMWLVCSALVEGNTVVFKPSEETPAVAQRTVEMFAQAGLPPGVLNLVQGFGEEAGSPLVNHPEVDVVAFTGSYEVGSSIKQACAAAPWKLAVCEMGGKNALIVLDDANLELAVNAAILSAFKTSGQRCVSAGRLIVQEGILEKFTRALVDTARRIKVGDALEEDTFMGPLVSEAGMARVLGYNQLAVAEGGQVLLNGPARPDGPFSQGYFLPPFIYRMEARAGVRVLREEVFGPHVAIIPFKTIDDAINIYNDTDYGLALAVITEDYRKARILREECEYGVGYVNLPTIGAEVQLPFGGVKRSGTGMPSAAALIDAVTHRVSWTVNHAEEIKMAQGLSTKL